MINEEKENISFDPEILRQKYLQERDKRVRADGNDQYVEVKGDFSYFVEDPYVTENMLLMWDNRTVMHMADGGYDGYDRLLHRITIAN